MSCVLYQGDLRQRQPVNSNHFEITVYEHQSAALTLSSLDQVRERNTRDHFTVDPFPDSLVVVVIRNIMFSVSKYPTILKLCKISSLFNLDCNDK